MAQDWLGCFSSSLFLARSVVKQPGEAEPVEVNGTVTLRKPRRKSSGPSKKCLPSLNRNEEERNGKKEREHTMLGSSPRSSELWSDECNGA